VSLALVATLDAQAIAARVPQSPAQHLRAMAPPAAARLRAYIEDRLAETISVAEVAGHVGMSPQHFARVFKASFGVPLHRYVLQRRVARAQQMLTRSSLPLAEVALSCGFSSQAHLGFVFKVHTGMAPGQYRRTVV
jgi:AraC family transcriptional regulator